MELVFNIWFIVDIGTDLSNYAIVKPYCLSGSDNDKFEILKKLADTDYCTSERINFAENCVIKFDSQNSITGYIHKTSINNYFDLNMEFFLIEMEKQLPQIFKFKGDFLGESKAINQKFPEEPLFVLTFLMENEYGEIKPYTSLENKAWYESEKIRIDLKSKGMQN
jgi:hypothetical protein